MAIPIYLSTIALATTFRKLQSILEAMALANKVFPVPGGPYKSTPFGVLIPTPKHHYSEIYFEKVVLTLKQFWIGERQFHNFSQFSQLLGKTTNIGIRHMPRIFRQHIVNKGIYLSRKYTHNGQSSHIQRDLTKTSFGK